MLPVLWRYGGRGSWCHTIVEFLTRGCEHYEVGKDTGKFQHDNAIVVVKADSVPSVEQLNSDLEQFEHVVLFVAGNEEGTFPVKKISHPNCKIWLQTPSPNQ